jgi:hypothetical protein
MHALVVGSLVFVLVFGGALVGMALRRTVPAGHLVPDAKDTVRLAIGLIVTMTGLVLGMLVSSAKSYYDGQKNVVAEMSSQIILLDNLLTDYGPETEEVRKQAHDVIGDSVDRIWPRSESQLLQLKPRNTGDRINELLGLLVPKDERQAALKAQIASVVRGVRTTYWLMYLQSEQTSASLPLLMVVTSWLVAIFVSFGIFAPRNPTVMVTLIICALAVSAAMFIIVSMYSPFSGILKISPVAVRDALTQMGTER